MRTTIAALFAIALPLAAQVKLPAYAKEVLPNGVVLLLMQKPGVPLVHFRVEIKGGVEAEPPELAGLGAMTAQLLRRGTAKRTADQFSQELDFLGGSFTAFLDGSPASATAVVSEFLKKDFNQGLDLLSDAVLHPTFPEADVKKELSRIIDAVRGSKDNPQAAIQNYSTRFFYGANHPFGNPADEATLGRIQQKDIAAFHQRVFCGRNLMVAVAGDFDPAMAKAALTKVFGAVPAGTAFQWPAAPALARKGKLLLIDKPDATQTYFNIMQPGIDARSPDRVKIELVNTLFGGRFTSMLNEELRVNTGLTYGARSGYSSARVPGALSIYTYTKVDTTVRAMDLALELLKKLHDTGITAAQLSSAKAYMKGVFPTRKLETVDQLADEMTELELQGMTRDEIDGYFERIDAITLEQANAIAKKYYRPDDLTFVVLGPAAKIRDQVKKYAPTVTGVSLKEPGWGSAAK